MSTLQAENPAALDFLGRLSQAHRQAEAPAPSSGRRLTMRKRDRIAAAYDAAQTTELNSRYWRRADTLDARAANSPGVRREIRSRARYEVFEANSFARGIVDTLANDLIGSGPRLQVSLPLDLDPQRTLSTQIEAAFNRHARRIRLGQKLRTMKNARTVDGEAFATFITNRRLPDVQLDLQTIEADQIASASLFLQDERHDDGIDFDEDDNPQTFHKLKSHPGAIGHLGSLYEADPIAAADMLHTFRHDRPGQRRGISELATALPLFALLRDYTLAVLQNARTAAKFTGVLQTDTGAYNDAGEKFDESVEPFDFVDVDNDMLTALPFGWKLSQLKAEQPATTYEMFRNAILNEIARCVSMPFGIAAGNSSGYNFSSAKMDSANYHLALDVERSDWELDVCNRILAKWFDEALFLPGLLPDGLPPFSSITHSWHWDARNPIDEVKKATSQKIKLSSGTTSRAREYGRDGKDIDEEDRLAAESFGVSVEEYRRRIFDSLVPPKSTPAPSNTDQDTDDEANETAADESTENTTEPDAAAA